VALRRQTHGHPHPDAFRYLFETAAGSRSGRETLLVAEKCEARFDLESARILIERLGGLCPAPSLVAK
jgi:hypothetical protein